MNTTISADDRTFVEEANSSSRTPVVFVHGLWLHASSWDPWIELFTGTGFVAYAPNWPGDGATVAESRKHPELIANQGVEQITERYRRLIALLDETPIVIGHSFGGLIAQKLLGENLASAAVAIDPAQMKGVVRLPLVQLWNALPVLGDPAQFRGANSQSKARFASSFGNELSRDESDAIHDRYTIPAPGRPLFEAGAANLVPNTPASVNTNADRGPLLIIGGGKDHTVPAATTRSIFKQYAKSPSVTEYKEFGDRGHSLVVDSGWHEVADYALEWLAFVGEDSHKAEA